MFEVNSLTKRFGGTLAVDDLSFRVEPGRIVGFLGPNGAGKTTTLRTILGLTVPSSGSATVDGVSYRSLPRPLETVGSVFEGSQFHPGRSGRSHLRVVATAARLPMGRVDELLELVELTGAARKRVKGYSLGMRQRLSLATALLGDPTGLILDEPANGLDPQGIRWLRDFLRARRDEGKTILVSSHVLSEVAQVADEVIVINRGRMVASGTVEELTRGGSGGLQVRTREPEALTKALEGKGATVSPAPGDGRLSVQGVPAETVGDLAAEAGIPIYELREAEQTLEDVFLELTRDPGEEAAA